MPAVRSSDAESGIEIESLVPSKLTADPNRPAVVRVAPERVPWLLRPESSVTTGPVGSAKLYAPTSPPGLLVVFDTVTVTADDVLTLPAASRATAVSVCDPFALVDVSHDT